MTLKRRSVLRLPAFLLLGGGALGAAPKPATIRVGPFGEVLTIAQAAALANDGDTVEVEAGEYRGDVAVWRQRRLTIRAVGGRARLIADGKAAAGKGIWVIHHGDFIVEGFDFEGARVPHRNGAGIRFDRGRLTVRDSSFIDNENGILTGNTDDSELVIENCLFSGNGYGDGQSHNLYVGRIAKLVVKASYFRQAKVGHLLKSRARVSDVLYNRLTDEIGGRASYELEFPAGGYVTVLGNLLEQSDTTENSTIVSYGAEGYRWADNSFRFVHNTVVNRRAAGAVFVRALKGDASALIADNVFAGRGKLRIAIPVIETGNVSVGIGELADADSYDYGLPSKYALSLRAGSNGGDRTMTHRYVHERRLEALIEAPTVPGAVQP